MPDDILQVIAAAPPPTPPPAKPGKLQAVAIIGLIQAILSIGMAFLWFFYAAAITVATLGLGFISCVVPIYYAILATVGLLRATKLMANPVKSTSPPGMAVPVMQIVAILFCDPIALGAGIATLVLQSDAEVKDYFVRLAAWTGRDPGAV